LRRLEHPGLARHIETFQGPGLFQAGEIDDVDLGSDLVYVAAEWVPGTPLGELHRSPTVSEAMRIISDVASAVAYLHEKGLTHRDLHLGTSSSAMRGQPW
jgi:serine/threonine protein kinase